MKKLFRAQGYVVENPPPVPPVQNFHHEPKVDNNDLLLEVHSMGEMSLIRGTLRIRSQRLAWTKLSDKDWWVFKSWFITLSLLHRCASLPWSSRQRWLVWQMLSRGENRPSVIVSYQPPWKLPPHESLKGWLWCLLRGQVEVESSREAIETILTHTNRPVDLIRRKNVTKEVNTSTDMRARMNDANGNWIKTRCRWSSSICTRRRCRLGWRHRRTRQCTWPGGKKTSV